MKAVQVASDAEIYFQREQVGDTCGTCGDTGDFGTCEGLFMLEP